MDGRVTSNGDRDGMKIKVKLADGKARTIQHMMCTTFWHPDGTPMSAQQFMEMLFGRLSDGSSPKVCRPSGNRRHRCPPFWGGVARQPDGPGRGRSHMSRIGSAPRRRESSVEEESTRRVVD
jgi:hypothetical protein